MKAGSEKVAPKVSTLTEVSFATTLTGERTNIGYIQSVSEFLTTPDEITYSALDIEDERTAKGRRKAGAIEIPWLYTEEQWDELKAVEENFKGKKYKLTIKIPALSGVFLKKKSKAVRLD